MHVRNDLPTRAYRVSQCCCSGLHGMRTVDVGSSYAKGKYDSGTSDKSDGGKDERFDPGGN